MKTRESIPLVRLLMSVQDPRKRMASVQYPLHEILFQIFVGIVCNFNTFEEIRLFVSQNWEWFLHFIPMENGLPDESAYRRVLACIDPGQMHVMFASWMQSVLSEVYGVVAVDGKTCRGSITDKKSPTHILTAYSEYWNASLAQISTKDHKSEIKAIPELLDMLCLKGCVVTIDAMGTQWAIARQLTDKGAFFLLPLKDNQRKLMLLAAAALEPVINSTNEDDLEYQEEVYTISDAKAGQEVSVPSMTAMEMETETPEAQDHFGSTAEETEAPGTQDLLGSAAAEETETPGAQDLLDSAAAEETETPGPQDLLGSAAAEETETPGAQDHFGSAAAEEKIDDLSIPTQKVINLVKASSDGAFAMSVEVGHGRTETRRAYIVNDVSWMETDLWEKWGNPTGVGVIIKETVNKKNEKVSVSKTYYLYSVPSMTASKLLLYRRAHWAVETCHYGLDVFVGEDDNHSYMGNIAENMNVIRQMSTNVLREEKSWKASTPLKRVRCCLDVEYRDRVLSNIIHMKPWG